MAAMAYDKKEEEKKWKKHGKMHQKKLKHG
jgi:hypothetical protein